MNKPVSLDPLDLAALLCSRLCHDVISPVGAIVNGLEVLEDEKDEAMKQVAMELVRKSAKQATARLQFARLAFGAAGSAGAQIDLGDAESVARGLLNDERTTIEWKLPRLLLPKNRVKLLLNLLLIANSMIPRGGKIEVEAMGEGEGMGFRLRAQGANARIPAAVPGLLAGTPAEGIDAHGIQPYYTGLVANAAGLAVDVRNEGENVVISASKA
jgi:histidine phosphotransferase ChpT